jgi:hypothetical protein
MIVTTTKGDMDDSLLEKKTGAVDNDKEYTEWVEYWLEGELVHRSVHVHLKTNVLADGVAAMLG